jgi:2-keto-3-deoxy-L-rhamnonate aldolase RhmA
MSVSIRNEFLQRIEAGGRVPLGSWLMSGGATTAEALGFAGFDFLVLDMEHVPIDVPDAVEILRTLAGTPALPVVRLPWNEQIIVKRMLDGGARTLMFPFIENAEQARQAVSFTRYPPHGVRGVAAIHRASRFGQVPNYLANAADSLCVFAQLESPGAVARMDEIAGVPGIDGLFLGPGDLSAAMGHIGDIAHADVQALIAQAAQRARELGKPIGIVGPNPDMVRRFLDYGYSYAAVGSDMAMMVGRAGEFVAALRDQAKPAAGTAAY